MNVRRYSIPSLAACLLLSVIPGCSTSGDSSSDHGGQTLASGDPVPNGARLVAGGDGPLDYTATSEGTVYVQDASTQTTIVSKRVEKGDGVQLQFDKDRVRIGNQTVYSGDLVRGHKHRIYFVGAN